MAERRSVPFFCDECGVELSTGYVCWKCKKVLCYRHYFGGRTGPTRRRDGLCGGCAGSGKAVNEKAEQA